MSLITRIDEAHHGRSAPPISSRTWDFGIGDQKTAEYGDYLATSNDVYSVAWTIAKMLAKLPVTALNTAGKAVPESHPLLRLMDRPNPHTTGLKFRLFIQLCLSIWGRAPVIIERQGKTVRELWPVKPTLITPVGHPTELISHYLFVSPDGAKTQRFEVSDVIWLAYPDPNDASQLGSLAPMGAARLAADTARESQLANRNLFRQGMIGGGFVLPPEGTTLSFEQAQQIEKALDQRSRGTDRAHRFSVFEHPFRLETMSVSPKDAQFIEGMNLSFRQVCKAMGITPQLVGDAEFATLANLRVYERLFWEQTGEFNALFWGAEMTRQLAPSFGLSEIGLSLVDVVALQEDENEGWTRNKSQIDVGAKTINEWRESQGLDRVAWGDVWWAPGLLRPVADDQEEATESSRGLWRDRALAPLTEALEEEFRSLFRRQRDDIHRRIRAGERTVAFDPGVWGGRFDETLTPRLTAILQTCLEQGAAEVGVPAPTLRRATVDSLLEIVAAVSAVDLPLVGEVEEIIVEADRILGERSPRRAADATTAAAQSLGFLAAWFGTGVSKRWRTAGDDRVRPTHAHLEGKTKDLDELFRVGDCYGLGPGLVAGCPEELFNCRCYLVAVQPKRGVDDQSAMLAVMRQHLAGT